MVYDLIVVGAGPAGSTTAREAATAGAKVLLLDRATFPRDKPCGGGVNLRAARLLPFSLAPVTERTIFDLRVSVDLQGSFGRGYPAPLCYMTQRARLDAFLVEKAVEAGARLREGAAVRALDLDGAMPAVRSKDDVFYGRAIVGADGANGVVARAAGLAGRRNLAVALEANYHGADRLAQPWERGIALDLGIIPGGYGWLFPKEDHLNIGVGGWQHFGPTLRQRLDRLGAFFGFSAAEARHLRGHHLPIRVAGAPLARGPVLLVGDAAGLIDPLSGEGIFGAIASGRRAAAHAVRYLSGDAPDLMAYEHEINATLGPELLASQRFQDVFHLMPHIYAGMLRHSERLWHMLCRLVRGEVTYLDLRRRIGPLAGMVDALSFVVRSTPLKERVGLTVPG